MGDIPRSKSLGFCHTATSRTAVYQSLVEGMVRDARIKSYLRSSAPMKFQRQNLLRYFLDEQLYLLTLTTHSPQPNMKIGDIDHIEIFVRDRIKAAQWYEKIFGLSPIQEFDAWAKIGPLFIGNKDRTVKLALINGTKDNDGSVNRMAFSASGENFVRFISSLDEERVYFLKRRVTNNDLVDHDLSYSIYFDDPDGNKLELTCYDHDYVKSKI